MSIQVTGDKLSLNFLTDIEGKAFGIKNEKSCKYRSLNENLFIYLF